MNTAPSDGPAAPAVPPPLTVAVSLALLEALVLVGYGLLLVPQIEGERVALGLTSVAFFFLYGGFLAFCAWRAYRLSSWARAPLVLTQLIQILVGASFWGGSTTPVALVLVGTAVVAVAAILHPASIRALADEG